MSGASGFKARLEGAEWLLLAKCLRDPQAAVEGFSALSSEEFLSERVAALWTSAKRLWDANGELSKAVLMLQGFDASADELQNLNALGEQAEGRPVDEYLESVRVAHGMYDLVRACGSVARLVESAGFSTSEFDSISGWLRGKIDELGLKHAPKSGEDWTLRSGIEEYLNDDSPRLERITTGLPTVDKRLGDGLEMGRLTIPIARSGEGKTCLCLTMTHAAIKRGQRVLYVSVEETKPQLSKKVLCIENDTKDPKADIAEGKQVSLLEGVDGLLDLYPADLSRHIDPIVAHVQKEALGDRPYKLVVLDFMQHLKGNGDDANARLSDISYKAKHLAQRACCHVVLAAQISQKGNQEMDDRTDRSPRIGDIRGTSTAGNAADSVIAIRKMPGGNENSAWYPMKISLPKTRVGNNSELPWLTTGESPLFRMGAGTFRIYEYDPWDNPEMASAAEVLQ